MKKIAKSTLLLLLLFLLLPIRSSFGAKSESRFRYVLRADVTLFQGQQQQTRVYLKPKKINSVLNYLRRTSPRGKVAQAQAVSDSHHYCIRLYYCDGDTQDYYLQDYQYFCKDPTLWQKVSRSHAQYLYPLIQLLPSDL